MFKAFFYGLLVGLICAGFGWFSFGRNDLREIRSDLNNVNGDFKGVQRAVSELGTNSDGFARNITSITETSKRITDRVGTLESGLAEVDGTIRDITSKVDDLERWNIRTVQLGRDLGDVSFDIRRLSEESREEK